MRDYYPLNQQNKTPDKRYTINLEFCGHEKKQYVVRYLDNFIVSSPNISSAINKAYLHDADRCGVSRPVDLINI